MEPAALKIREDIVRIAHHSGHGHIPTCFSIVELLLAVYGTMRHDPRNPGWEERDICILSKGHGALALYATLAHAGYFPIEEVFDFGAFTSRFGCHPDRHTVPGVELSTGSLGHGIGVAVGMALGFRRAGSGRRAFVIVGDGESNEGTVWEALMVAAHFRLDNLCVLFDHNRSQARCLPITEPEAKFAAFGAAVRRVDGHALDQVVGAIREPAGGKPVVVVADTVKGKGCRSLEEDMFAWHRRSPTADEMARLLGELHATAI